MSDLNRVIIVGSVQPRDPELRYVGEGNARTEVTVAVKKSWKDPAGEWKEKTEWFRVVAWAKLAERIAEHVRRADKVLVEGAIETRSWEKDGVKQYRTELVATNFTRLTERTETAQAAPDAAPADIEGLPF